MTERKLAILQLLGVKEGDPIPASLSNLSYNAYQTIVKLLQEEQEMRLKNENKKHNNNNNNSN